MTPEKMACLIWAELCPGLIMGDADRPHYENAAKAVLALQPEPVQPAGKGEQEPVAWRMPEWRDHAEKLDEYIRKDNSQYSLALAAIIEILENVEAALQSDPVRRSTQEEDIVWRKVNDEPFEYAIQQNPLYGDAFVRLLNGKCLRRKTNDQ